MKLWIAWGLLAATLMVTGCATYGGYGRGYRYDRDYRYNRDYRHDWHRDYDRDRGYYRDR